MKTQYHIVISAGVSSGIYFFTKSKEFALSSFFAGFLIDLDHIYDYFKFAGFNLDIKKFFDDCDNYRLTKLRLFFHSYELIFILIFILFLTRYNMIIGGIIIGLVTHIFLDFVFNPVKPIAYFFIYRAKQNFLKERIFYDKT